MPTIQRLITVNHDIILFSYGLVFFVMGLAIALQSRIASRLDLARSLTWLAGFGLLHGLNEWGDLFIPIQKVYMSESAIRSLRIGQSVLLAASFACLFEFGVALLRPPGRRRWWFGIAAGLTVAWLAAAAVIAAVSGLDFESWQHTANALARYFIGFPAGLLAAFGLRWQARHLPALNPPHIVTSLRVAGIALGIYSVVGGLIPPPAPFFPASVINTMSVEQVIGVPVIILRSAIGAVVAMSIIRALEIFDVEIARMVESMEQQQILAAERDRIGRELHDGAIQSVYTAGLLMESARNLAAPGSPVASRLDTAMAVLDDAIGDLRRNLGELRTAPPEEPLPAALRRLARDDRLESLVEIQLDLDLPESESLSPPRAAHVLAIAHEALSNIVRHAHARHVAISAQRQDGRLLMTIQDDGQGLPPQAAAGYGLRNMRDRARLLGGQLNVSDARGKGTTVRLDVPWTDER